MKRQKEPQSAMAKLMMFIDNMDLFLHPRIMDGLKKAVWDARTEMAQEARDQKISLELQELEPWLERYKDAIAGYYNGGACQKYLWHMRPLLAKIIELYGKKSTKTAENYSANN
jgi:hypothetical protein